MMDKLCGVCFKWYKNLYQHLKVSHRIGNRQERSLLLKYGSARFSGVLTCPICDRTNLVRLDKHLIDQHEIWEYKERQPVLQAAKRTEIIKLLGELRRSEPERPMISILDILSTSRPDPETISIDEAMGDYNVIKVEVDTLPITSSMVCTQNLQPAETDDSGPCTLNTEFEVNMSSSCKTCCSYNLNEVSEELTYCKSQIEHLTNRVDMLNEYVIKPKKQQTLKKSVNTHPYVMSVERAELKEKRTDDLHLYELILKDFKTFQEGTRTGNSQFINAQQAEKHAKKFCWYMLGENPSSARHQDLTFLYRMDKLYLFPGYLADEGYAPASIKKWLVSVVTFLKHIESNFLKPSKLTHKKLAEMSGVIKTLKAGLSSKRPIQDYRHWKTENDFRTGVETEFLIVAKQKIPMLLKDLRRSPNMMADHNKLMGYMMGYFAILSKNSLLKLTDMIRGNVTSAKSWRGKSVIRIKVGDYSNVHSSRKAILFLGLEEYKWLIQLITTSCCSKASQCQYVFHTMLGNKISIPGTLFRAACIDSGIETSTFLSTEQRQQLEKVISSYSETEAPKGHVQHPTEGSYPNAEEDLPLEDKELSKTKQNQQEEEMDWEPVVGMLSSPFPAAKEAITKKKRVKQENIHLSHGSPSKLTIQLKYFDQALVEDCHTENGYNKVAPQLGVQETGWSLEDIQKEGLPGQPPSGISTADFSIQYPPESPFFTYDLKVKQEPSDQ